MCFYLKGIGIPFSLPCKYFYCHCTYNFAKNIDILCCVYKKKYLISLTDFLFENS